MRLHSEQATLSPEGEAGSIRLGTGCVPPRSVSVRDKVVLAPGWPQEDTLHAGTVGLAI